MNAYLNYFLESAIVLLVTYVAYHFLFRNETAFTFRRTYLHAALFASILLPLIHFPTQQEIPSLSPVVGQYLLPATGQSLQSTSTSFSSASLIIAIYFGVASVFLILLAVRLFNLYRILRLPVSKSRNGYSVILTHRPIPIFSFFNKIVIGNADWFTEDEKRQIENHESLHTQRFHSADILLAELLKIFFWFNPVVYFFKREFSLLHEYEADQYSLQHTDAVSYTTLLARVSLMSSGFPIANHFIHTFTFKRLAMMKTLKKGLTRWKALAVIPIVIGLSVFISCQDQLFDEITGHSQIALNAPSQFTPYIPEWPIEIQNPEVAKAEESKTEILIKEEVQTELAQPAELKPIVANRDTLIQEQKTESVPPDIQTTYNEPAEEPKREIESPHNGEVLVIVEEGASPVGGLPTFYQYIQSNLLYPSQARRMGVEGKVFVEFIINSDGSITDVKVVKGIGGGCDEEAKRVMENAPGWKPGKQRGVAVRQRMVLPITFQLG